MDSANGSTFMDSYKEFSNARYFRVALHRDKQFGIHSFQFRAIGRDGFQATRLNGSTVTLMAVQCGLWAS